MREILSCGVVSRFRAFLRGTRRSLRAQAGFTLIEVVVSGGLLVVVAGGVLAGIDGPSNISTKNEVRTQGSALAQQDQERMRAMSITALNGYQQTRPVAVAGVTYSVYSRAIWIRDATDTSSCTVPVDDTSGDYLKLTSRVTPPGPGTPVELNSLMSLPPGTSQNANKGDLSIQLKNQLDQPVVGQNVSIAGPANMTVATNSEGCAVFGLVDQGTYTVSYSRGGWVDPSAVSNVSFNTSVTAGSSSVVAKNYAQAGTISASVNTSVSGTVSTSLAKGVTVVNAGIPTGTLTFPAVPASGSSSFSMPVYPFPSGYGVWAGTCTSGNPTLYGQPAVTAAPGPGATVAVTLRQPSINISTATGVPGFPTGYPIPSGALEIWTSISSGCNEKYTQTTTTGGKVPQPGAPYGAYKLCASVSGSYAQNDNFVNQVPAGSAPTISYRGSGVCT